MSSASHRTAARLDWLGLILVGVFGGWVLLLAEAGSGRRATAGTLVGLVVVFWASVRLTRVSSWVVPALVAASPFIAAVATGRGLLPQGPLSYQNASASLTFLGAAGALMVAARAPRRARRVAAVGVYTLYALMPLAIESIAAGLMALLLPLGLLPMWRSGAVRALVVAGLIGVVLALSLTAVLGATYDPASRSGVVDQVVDATLSERRPQLWSEALAMVEGDPVTGVGPGRFAQFSPTARLDPDASWAHNEFLEVAGETGLVGLVLGLTVLAWALVRPWWGPGDAGAGVAVVAVAGVAVHATIDYVLHFPAVPLATAAVLGAGLTLDARGTGTSDVAAGRYPGGHLVLVLPSVAIAVLLVCRAVH